MSPDTNERIRANRPSVVVSSSFFSEKISEGTVTVIAALNDAATDAEFVEYWKESKGNRDLAIASFKSTFGKDISIPAVPETPAAADKKLIDLTPKALSKKELKRLAAEQTLGEHQTTKETK